jgi:hypothetical protein
LRCHPERLCARDLLVDASRKADLSPDEAGFRVTVTRFSQIDNASTGAEFWSFCVEHGSSISVNQVAAGCPISQLNIDAAWSGRNVYDPERDPQNLKCPSGSLFERTQHNS